MFYLQFAGSTFKKVDEELNHTQRCTRSCMNYRQVIAKELNHDDKDEMLPLLIEY